MAAGATPALGTADAPLRVAVVGSGPSGFYAAEALLEAGLAVEIDLLERLPVPYGLVRYGVAPDHPKLKSVTAVFCQIAQDPRLRFFGNVALGRDLTTDHLGSMYHAVIVATGADADRRLGIDGEDLLGVHAASDFVGWYNGKPECADLRFDLSRQVAIVVGHGNVAIDVCRILAKPVDDLRRTDITDYAIAALASSCVREIHLVGRRGPVQARFTPKELRELGSLPGWQPVVDPVSLELNAESQVEVMHPDFVHAAKNLEVLRGFATQPARVARRIHFHFLQSPIVLDGDRRLCRVTLETQRLAGPPAAQTAIATGRRSAIAAGLLFRSVGYRGLPVPGLPFDERNGVVPNEHGQVRTVDGKRLAGWYVTGWIKRGPTGIIGTNRADSVDTVARLLGDLPMMSTPKAGRSALLDVLSQRARPVVSFADCQLIEQAERQRGLLADKTAEKFVRVSEMLAAARGLNRPSANAPARWS